MKYHRSLSLFGIVLIASCVRSSLSLPQSGENTAVDDDDCSIPGNSNLFGNVEKWFNGMKDHGQQFLEEHVFNQKQEDLSANRDPFPSLQNPPKYHDNDPFSSISQTISSMFEAKTEDQPTPSPHKEQDSVLSSIITTAQKFAEGKNQNSRNFHQAWTLFGEFFGEAMNQMKKTFEHINFDRFNPIGMMYFVEHEDEIKNPSWKRRRHRFHQPLQIETVQELHNALYVSHLSYVDTVAGIRDGLKMFLNNSYELIYSKIDGLPGEPAHFIAIRKEAAPLKAKKWPPLFSPPKEVNLEIMLVVRGTKEFGDILSDGLLDAADFRDGKAHAGIAKAGKYLVDQHLDLFKELLGVSKRKKIRLSMVGHSLGAGAAAIAAVLFNEVEWIDASAVAFGCPALLSWELSQSAKDYITTVVTDSDVIPRMSGASISNMFLDVMSFDWTNKALEDIGMVLDYFNVPNCDGLLKWANETFDREDRPFFPTITKERRKPVLFPPGTCIHLYRDGIGFSGTYTPCSFFDQIDVTRTMVDDHLIPTGYHRAFLDLLRDSKKDLNFDFDHDVMAIKV
mmetsp:Transcript_37693/g.53158  ORF Transcript_37693/g.53158 Transcript_37693/m.53158 type:complete len:564 (-) Transcript_37693:56-1747(-)